MRTVKTSTWWDEHLTADNVEFMKREVTEEHRELTAAKMNPLKDEPWPRHEWDGRESHASSKMKVFFFLRFKEFNLKCVFTESRRVGLVAVKLGMMPVWTRSGDRHVVTMLQVLYSLEGSAVSHLQFRLGVMLKQQKNIHLF